MLKNILTGSTILKQHFPKFREPKDVDYFVDDKNLKSGKVYHNICL